jgi:hypothetical protein
MGGKGRFKRSEDPFHRRVAKPDPGASFSPTPPNCGSIQGQAVVCGSGRAGGDRFEPHPCRHDRFRLPGSQERSANVPRSPTLAPGEFVSSVAARWRRPCWPTAPSSKPITPERCAPAAAVAAGAGDQPPPRGGAQPHGPGLHAAPARRRASANLNDIDAYALSRCRQGDLGERLAAVNLRAEAVASRIRALSGGKVLYAVRVSTNSPAAACPCAAPRRFPPTEKEAYAPMRAL